MTAPTIRPTLGELAAGTVENRHWKCPECGCRHLDVANKWINKDGTVRRLRKCRNCGAPVHSSEKIEE